jgi:hypothetical protein
MNFLHTKLILFLLFNLFNASHSLAQTRENIVLLPLELSPEYANQEKLLGVALQQSLSKNFNVFYGDSVEAALQAEYAKENCSAESCVQNIAILFNGEIVVDASVQRVEKSTFLSVQFLNVITSELEAVVQAACEKCSFTQLIDFIDEKTNNVALKSSQGLAALLYKKAEPSRPRVATPQKEQLKESVIATQESTNPQPKPTNSQPKVAKSSSYWKWGLGALVLGAAGGGGGGGGGDSPSDSGASTPTNITPFDTPGAAWIDSPNLLGGAYTYIVMPQTDNKKFYRMSYKYGGGGSLPIIDNLSVHSQSYSGYENLFQFQVVGRNIRRLALVDSSLSDFDVADGGNITHSLADMSHLSYFTNDDGEEFLGLALTADYQTNVNGIARNFFGVSEVAYSGGDEFDRVVRAFHSGQQTPDGRLPTSGEVEFSGFSAGQWVSHDDVSYWTTSDIDVTVDFDNTGSGAELASSNTRISSDPGQAGSWSVQNDLNFIVEGAVLESPKRIGAASTNAVGDTLPTLSSDGQAEGGAWAGFFYDENGAYETSGTFTFHRGDSSRGDKYIGAFGARRQ